MPAGEDLEVDVRRQRRAFRVHAKNLFAASHVGTGNRDAPVEAAGSQNRRVEHVGAVGGGDDDDAVVGFEPVHLDEELIQRLLALVVPAAEARATMTADGVDLVDEDDARRVLLALLEEIAHAARADPDEHLHEVRAGDAEEGNARLAGDGPGQERLARAGRPDEQDALGDAPAEALELLRILEEGDDFFDFVFGLVDPGHVGERHLVLRVAEHPRLGLAEGHRLAAARLKLAHEEEEHDPDEEHRQERHEGGRPEGSRVFLLEVDLEFPVLRERIVVLQVHDEGFVGAWAQRFHLLAFAVEYVRKGVLAILHADFGHLSLVHPAHEFAEADLLLSLAGLKHLPNREEHHDQQDPEQQRLVRLLHVDLIFAMLR